MRSRPMRRQSGSSGGTIVVEAKGTPSVCCVADPPVTGIDLDASAVFANGNDSNGGGGPISLLSYQAGITGGAPGVLMSNGDNNPNRDGTVTLEACIDPVSYTGTVIGIRINITRPSCTGAPTFPAYVVFDRSGVWTYCSQSTISGMKFKDLAPFGQKDATDPPLSGWTINLYQSPDFVVPFATTTTNGSGNYSFTVQPGLYRVCEVPQPELGYVQTFPTTGPDCPAGGTPPTVTKGYDVDLTGTCCDGTDITGKDFGNRLAFTPPNKSGQKFEDLNGNGLKDSGEELAGLSGWTIQLRQGARWSRTSRPPSRTAVTPSRSTRRGPTRSVRCC